MRKFEFFAFQSDGDFSNYLPSNKMNLKMPQIRANWNTRKQFTHKWFTRKYDSLLLKE